MIEPGDRVRIVVDHGQVVAGETGSVISYDAETGVYFVELDDGPASVLLQAAELTRIPRGDGSRGAKIGS